METNFLYQAINFEDKRHWIFSVEEEDFQDQRVRQAVQIVKDNIEMESQDLFLLVSQKTGIDPMEMLQADMELTVTPKMIRAISDRRKVQNALQQLQADLNDTRLTNHEVSEEFMKWAMDLANERDFAFKDMAQVGESLKDHFRRVWNGQSLLILPFMKDLVADLMGGELIILAGRPSMGKSCVMLSQAVQLAQNGIPAAYISLEMDAENLYMRIVQRHFDKSLRLQQRYLTKDERVKLEDYIDSYKQLPLYFSDVYSADLGAMLAAIERLVLTKGVKVVFIDYLQLIKGNANKGKNEQVAEITRALVVLIHRLKIPIVLGSQLNRAVEMREDKRPHLSDLRDSGAIEQDADVVIFCYRDGYYNYQSDEEELELIVAKQRDGALGKQTVRLILPRQLVVKQEVVDGRDY